MIEYKSSLTTFSLNPKLKFVLHPLLLQLKSFLFLEAKRIQDISLFPKCLRLPSISNLVPEIQVALSYVTSLSNDQRSYEHKM